MAGQDLPLLLQPLPQGAMKSSCSKPVFAFFPLCVCDACMHLCVYRHMCVQVYCVYCVSNVGCLLDHSIC